MSVWHYVQKTETRLLDIDPEHPEQGKAYLPIAVQIVFFITIPDVNNRADVSYRVAARDERYSKELDEVPSSVVDLQAKNETVYNALQTGAVYEKSERFAFSKAYLSDVQRDAEIDARAAAAESDILAEKQRDWQYWGYEQTI